MVHATLDVLDFVYLGFFSYNSFSISPSFCLEYRWNGWAPEAQMDHEMTWECTSYTKKQNNANTGLMFFILLECEREINYVIQVTVILCGIRHQI